MQRAPGLFVIAWALFCANASLYGQLNESDTAHFQIRISASGHWQRGNVDYVALRTRADAVWRITDGWAFKTQNASLYQSFSGRRADNDVNSRNYFYFKPQQRIYP
ncbi:MAG TPA: hypothetical protein PKD90_12060, partial [Phnomibacter sp.]|nr:hypothetical protein [Phnomibacter sp.]